MLTLAGCAQHPKQPITPTAPINAKQSEQRWQHHQQQLSALDHWQAEGRMAAAHGQKGGNASFVWVQRGDAYQIKLFGPFGSGAIYINGRPQYVELRESNGKTTQAQSPEMLLKKVAGWQVPLTGLQHWMRGMPMPQAQSSQQQLDSQGQLKHLTQQGWQIEYEEYQNNSMPALPSKLRLQNGDTKLKMIVTSWKALGSSPRKVD